jgi:hypothetical protein
MLPEVAMPIPMPPRTRRTNVQPEDAGGAGEREAGACRGDRCHPDALGCRRCEAPVTEPPRKPAPCRRRTRQLRSGGCASEGLPGNRGAKRGEVAAERPGGDKDAGGERQIAARRLRDSETWH